MLLSTPFDDALVALCCGLLLVGLALYVLPHLVQTGAPATRPIRHHAPTAAGASVGASRGQSSTARLVSGPRGKAAWWDSPLADAAETVTITAAIPLVDRDLLPLPPHAEIGMLRVLRTLGHEPAPSQLAHKYSRILRWRRNNVPPLPKGRQAVWPAAIEFANGEWASECVLLGFSRGASALALSPTPTLTLAPPSPHAHQVRAARLQSRPEHRRPPDQARTRRLWNDCRGVGQSH